jgi:hypothetical protein
MGRMRDCSSGMVGKLILMYAQKGLGLLWLYYLRCAVSWWLLVTLVVGSSIYMVVLGFLATYCEPSVCMYSQIVSLPP